jgi:hypothetical protein
LEGRSSNGTGGAPLPRSVSTLQATLSRFGYAQQAGEFGDSLPDADISKRARAFTVQIECWK